MKIVQEINWNLAKADPNTGKLLNKNGKSIMQQCFEDFYFGSDTEDVGYVEVKDECKELPGRIMTLDECEKAYTDMMDKSFEPEQYAFFHPFKTVDVNDYAFYGHPLYSK